MLAEYSNDAYPDVEYVYADNRLVSILNSYDDDFDRPDVGLKVVSRGYEAGEDCDIYVNGTDYSVNLDGYNVVVVDEYSGAFIDSARFDVSSGSSSADALAAYINDLPVGRVVLAGIRDDGSQYMNESAYKALESIGSALCRDVGLNDSHALIGRKGAAMGSIPEMHIVSGTDHATAEVHKVDVRAKSAGAEDGNFVHLYVDGVRKELNQRGYNLVVVNESTGAYIESKRYDTYASSSEADAMASYINSLASGRIVLVGIRDEGHNNMNESAYQALESLGSSQCRDVGYRDSWALIGVKGASEGSVPEMHIAKGHGHADVESAFPLLYQTEGYRFVYQDHIGSTRQLSRSDMQRDYYPFGQTLNAAGDDLTSMQFSQKQVAPDSTLYYFGVRYYSPRIGRWLVPDPAGQGFCPYVYCGGNPVNMLDPDGALFGLMISSFRASLF